MLGLVFSFQWNIALNSFIMQTYYVSKMGNNFHSRGYAAPPDHLTSDKI